MITLCMQAMFVRILLTLSSHQPQSVGQLSNEMVQTHPHHVYTLRNLTVFHLHRFVSPSSKWRSRKWTRQHLGGLSVCPGLWSVLSV